VVDHVVFVAQPGAGDMLQFMKAGILELPDVFVVNKADLGPTAERTASELAAGLGLGEARGDGWRPPVLLASARDGVGISEIIEVVAAHRAHLDRSGELAHRRARGREDFVRSALVRRYGEYGLERLGGPTGLAARLARPGNGSAFRWVHVLGLEIEEALRQS
jgi:LAO/AO transport system kinase